MASAAAAVDVLWFASYRAFRRMARIREAVEGLGEPWPFHKDMPRTGEDFLSVARNQVIGR